MKGAAAVLRFLLDASARGERVALVTLTNVIARSSRAPGTQMGVSEGGGYQGSFSGGCVEAAVVAEAKRVIASGRAETVRFGDGSPFIDVVLPCGGGIDLLITPSPDPATLSTASQLLADRIPIALGLMKDGLLCVHGAGEAGQTGWRDGVFYARHDPDLRLMIIGHGEETRAMTAMASAFGALVTVLSPDSDLATQLALSGIDAHHLKTPARSEWLQTDRYTAVAMLFHDHDWEVELLEQALEQQAFFVGAMGSRSTHAARLTSLASRGVKPEICGRLVGPIGLIPATRDPETLALSALAEIAMRYDEMCNVQLSAVVQSSVLNMN